MANTPTIRAVVFEDRGRWLVQCLEYDLCTSAMNHKELMRKLAAQLRLQLMLDLVNGRSPFETLPRAPQKFWDMYSNSMAPETMLPIRGSWLGVFFRAWRGRVGLQAKIATAIT